MEALFGSEYFGFIASAFGVTTFALISLTLWIVFTYGKRKRDLAKLEAAGLKRAHKSNG